MDKTRTDALQDPALASSLEERSRRAIAERELRVDLHRLRRGSRVGIAVWAWLELAEGVNLFRRVLGAAALAWTVYMLQDDLSGGA